MAIAFSLDEKGSEPLMASMPRSAASDTVRPTIAISGSMNIVAGMAS